MNSSLTYFAYQIPLTTLGRRILHLEMDSILPLSTGFKDQCLNELLIWFESLPYHLRCHDFDENWMGRYITTMNMLYHHHRLWLLRSRFVAVLERNDHQRSSIFNELVVQESLNSAKVITSITGAFVKFSPGGIDKGTFNKLGFYVGGLYHCAIAAATGDYQSLIPLMETHMRALELISKGPSFSILRDCFRDPQRALVIIKTLMMYPRCRLILIEC